MRTIQWLFGISVALFVSGTGFVIAAVRNSCEVAPVEAPVDDPGGDVPAL